MSKKLYSESEIQGRGRRYWFVNESRLAQFVRERMAAGYPCVRDGLTVWVPFSKNISHSALKRQRAGMDPEES